MKNNQILIVVGVIALVLIIANWNKIFGKTENKRYGGGINDYRVGGPVSDSGSKQAGGKCTYTQSGDGWLCKCLGTLNDRGDCVPNANCPCKNA